MIEVREWSRSDTARLFRAPTAEDDKYARGVVALRTGSPAYPGAAVLGVEAAWRSGAGFVRYVGAERVADAVLARRPETVVGADIGSSRVGAWVIGSGTDPVHRTDAESVALREILAGAVPVVIDAGALDLAPGARAPFLVTPHAREFTRLQERLRVQPHDDEDDERADAARQVAAKIGGTVLLKGARTLVADPDGAVIAVEAGTGWLATAGTGDVLAGVLGAVSAANPGAALAEVAAAGAWLHGHAARIAARTLAGGPGHPIVAMDVAEALPQAIQDVLG
ncbi:NAD(P)H-hydrate dehydratase [Microbacterium sp. ISL-59]|uniref:ADP-dependent NAD(P)H-hydrate dehydratase n=1 Tax=Microbacterium sp. ISL-59 TaxID=2819159 RepID=UPI001BE919DB|nr:ADP/ATP-dependent (S)-NAD(P)H-hydrate dehydratase [Microbacterium sp. ISL-59]MBT2494530.1 NAD(P)H-hydrate dehydratase [Microbacterium sp. ISL-59]